MASYFGCGQSEDDVKIAAMQALTKAFGKDAAADVHVVYGTTKTYEQARAEIYGYTAPEKGLDFKPYVNRISY